MACAQASRCLYVRIRMRIAGPVDVKRICMPFISGMPCDDVYLRCCSSLLLYRYLARRHASPALCLPCQTMHFGRSARPSVCAYSLKRTVPPGHARCHSMQVSRPTDVCLGRDARAWDTILSACGIVCASMHACIYFPCAGDLVGHADAHTCVKSKDSTASCTWARNGRGNDDVCKAGCRPMESRSRESSWS